MTVTTRLLELRNLLELVAREGSAPGAEGAAE
jgi:hypothetical protein